MERRVHLYPEPSHHFRHRTQIHSLHIAQLLLPYFQQRVHTLVPHKLKNRAYLPLQGSSHTFLCPNNLIQRRATSSVNLVFDMGRQNPPGTRIWISRVQIPITFLGLAALPVPLSIKPVPASVGCDYKSCVGDCWSLPICCRGTLGIK